MKFLGLYFSGTGNTWYAMDKFMEISRESNHECLLYSVENKLKSVEDIAKEIMASDVLVIAYPSYASDMPIILKNYLVELEKYIDVDKSLCKSVFSLSTMGWFSGDGSVAPKEYVSKMGMTTKWSHNIVMPFNMGVPKLKMGPPSDKKIKTKLEAIDSVLIKMLKKIENNESHLQGTGPIGKFFGWGQRTFSTNMMHKFDIEIDQDKCKKCNLCVKSCPTKHLALDGSKSNYCLRCFNVCKDSALKVYNTSTDPDKHKRFGGPIENKDYLKEFRGE